jgi:hypothetical protein
MARKVSNQLLAQVKKAGANKQGGKGAPKLKRSGRHKVKYAAQFRRTYRNKLRRVRKHNGEAAAIAYAAKFAV